MKRRRRWELGSERRARIRCFSEMTVVEDGCGMSSSRSGIAALKRIVRSRGGGWGIVGDGGLRSGCEGGGEVVILWNVFYEASLSRRWT